MIAVDVAEPKLRAARSLGATRTVDATAADPVAEIRAATEGSGADSVIVTVGAAGAVDQGLACLRRGGTLVVVGMPPSGEPAHFDAGALAHDGKRILGSKLGSSRPGAGHPPHRRPLHGRPDQARRAGHRHLPARADQRCGRRDAPGRGDPKRDRAVSGSGERIASIESFTDQWVGFVRVRTDDGAEGWGQVSPYNADITAEVLHRQVAPHVLGGDPDAAAALGTSVLEAEHKYPGSYVCRALAGVDTALWDLRGRRAGVPVCELAGGAARPSPPTPRACAATSPRPTRPNGSCGCATSTASARSRSGSAASAATTATSGRAAPRRSSPPSAARWATARGCSSTRTAATRRARAIEVGRFLEQWGVEHFEEPCPYWELEWTAEVTAALDLDVAGGEQDCLLWQWRRMVALRAVDVVQPDVCYVGGFTRALAVARMAAAAGLPCVPHSANLSLVTVFAQHLMCAIPNAGPYLELAIEGAEYYPWQYDLYDPPPAVRDGQLAAPAGPGWGIEPNPRWLAAATHRESRLES